MRLIKNISKINNYINQAKRKSLTIGFVATMGYLHQGHLSLVGAAKKENDLVVVSIFVNPMQFGSGEDLKKYPRDISRDIKLLKKEEVDLVFSPSAGEMYKDPLTFVEVRGLSGLLCGRSRPGHFRGVTTVINKLFNIIRPDTAYFGQKDMQQAVIIKKMVRDLNLTVKIKVMPIIREKDGLAMSSRNTYLNPKQRKDAILLYQALKEAKKIILHGERKTLTIIKKMRKLISRGSSTKIDYIDIVDLDSLNKLKIVKRRVLIVLAVWVGKIRLIDNIIVNAKKT